MDGESCVMKYIDIVPVDNSRNYSDSSHVDFDPSRIKVGVSYFILLRTVKSVYDWYAQFLPQKLPPKVALAYDTSKVY